MARQVKVITAAEAAALIKNGDTVTTSGFVASAIPEALDRAVEERFLATGEPRDITYVYCGSQGNKDGRGAEHFAHEGLLKRYISPTFRTGITDVRLVDDGDDGSGHYTRFAYHRFIGGRIMDNNRGETAYNTSFYHLDEERTESLARRIAGFFVELHAVPADEIAEINGLMPEKRDNWNYAARIDFDYDLSRSLLLKYSKGLIDMDDFKTGFTDDVCFCHNDLSGSNILIDKDRTEVLSGIIDFGNANIAPRTDDFVPFYKVGRNLARRVIRHYNKLSDSPVSIREIDYKALSFIGYLMCFRYRRNEEPLEFSRAMTEHFANDIRAP